MVLSAVYTFPGSDFAVVLYAGDSCTSHTTCLLLALVFKVTNSLEVCASGLCFGMYLVIVGVELLSCIVLCNRRFCECSFVVLRRMSVVGSVLHCLRWRPSILMFWSMLVICDLILYMLCVSGTLLMHRQGRWSLSLCGKCMYKCWPKCCGLYLSGWRKAFTSSYFSGETTMPPFLSCLTVNVLPGNAYWSCCFAVFRSVCGFKLSIKWGGGGGVTSMLLLGVFFPGDEEVEE